MTLSGYIFLVILIIIPLVLQKVGKESFYKKYSVAFLSALIVYILIICYVFYLNYQLDNELYDCDLNNDGVFSTEEMTPQCQKTMNNWTNDVGRNFAPFTGFIFSFLYYMSISITMYIIKYLHRWRKLK